MRNRYLGVLAVLISFLVVSLPVCFADEINYVLDENGNVLSDGTYNRTYNSLNQLSLVKNASSGVVLQEYIMHPLDERVLVKKTYENNGSWKDTTIYVSKSFVKYKNTTHEVNYTYVYHNGQLVAQEAEGVKYFIHGDHIGTTTAVTNSTGGLEEITETSAFGEVISGGEVIDRIYEGKQYDPVLKDLDFHFRKYDPWTKLYFQPDSLIPDVFNSQALNRYMFELGNPLRYTDPDGHAWQLALVLVLVAFLFVYGMDAIEWVFAPVLEPMKDKIEKSVGNKGDIPEPINPEEEIDNELKKEEDLSWSVWEDSQSLVDSDSTKGTSNPSTYSNNIRNEANLHQNVNPNRDQLIREMREAGSADAVGGSGYNEDIGGYVTDDGRTYPTKNPNWTPNPDAPRVCVSGCNY